MPNFLYTDDNTVTHPIRLASATATAGSFTATGAAGSNIIAKVSKSGRAFGLRPRGVRLSRTVGTAPNQATRSKFLPVATPAAYNGAAFATGATVTISTVAWTVVGRKPEDY